MSVSDFPSAQALGRKAGDDIFELTRRRFASQGRGARASLASLYAGRGALGSGAFGSSLNELAREEARQLGEASIGSQVQGVQIGQTEANRLEGIRQFQENLGFQNKALDLNAALTREGFFNARELERLRGQQEMERLLLQERFGNAQSRRGLFGQLGGGIGSLLSQLFKINPVFTLGGGGTRSGG